MAFLGCLCTLYQTVKISYKTVKNRDHDSLSQALYSAGSRSQHGDHLLDELLKCWIVLKIPHHTLLLLLIMTKQGFNFIVLYSITADAWK